MVAVWLLLLLLRQAGLLQAASLKQRARQQQRVLRLLGIGCSIGGAA